MQGFDATDYLGKRIRVSAFVKGDGIGQRAEFWARVQAIDSPGDGRGLAGGRCALRRTFDWQPCEMVFDVPMTGNHIQVGAGLRGPGTLWMDDVRVEVVGEDVAVTRPPPPRTPQNLGFDR